MTRPIRVLHLEDSPRDAEIIRHALDVADLSCNILVASGQDSFETALAAESFDLILSDYNLPGFDGTAALKLAQTTQPDVPVILISGTVVEEQAVKCLHLGATDYLLKDRLDRLVPAVQRALQEAATQRTRQRAEAALGESEARKAAILDSVLDSIVTMDADGTVIEFNAAAARTFGYTRAEALGRSLAELIIPLRFRERHRAGLARYVTTGEGPLIGRLLELTAMRSDGVEFPVELAITVVRSGSGSLFTGVLRDMTARQEAEATRTRLAAIVDSSDDAIISVTMDGTILSWNAGAERLYEYPASEMIGRNHALLVPVGKHVELPAMMEKAARGEPGEPLETRRRRKDGSVVDVSVVISPMTDPTGCVTSVSTIARDITERKAAEVAASRLAAIVESSDDAVIGKDLTGRITSWNSAAEQVFGFTATEMVGTSIMRLIPADRGDEERQIIEQITRGERVKHFETRRQTKDGPLIDVSITVSPIKDAIGTVIGVSKVARDITERKRAEEIVRRTSGPVARNRSTRAGIELAMLATATASIYVLAARFEWFEGIAQWVLADNLQQLPEMMVSAVFIALGLLVFGFRRWRESASDLMSRQQAQAALGLLHDELDRRVKQRTQELGDTNQALHTEIAEHRRTGEALRTAEERIRFALENAKVGIWDIDYATGALQWSGILEAQYGLQPGTFGGTFDAFIERIHPDDRESVNDTFGKGMTSGADFSLLNRSLSPDGTVRWLLGAGRIRLGEHGEAVRGIGISQDVTELKRLNEEIQLQRLRVFKATIRTVQDIVNNLLNSFHLVRLEGEGQLPVELLTLVDQMIQEAGVKLQTLGDLETVNEKEMIIGPGIDYPGAGF